MTDAFRRELVELIPRLVRFARGLTGDAALAEDLAHDTLERALERRGQWRDGSRLDSWVYRIAQNLWIDDRRKVRARGHHLDIERAHDVSGVDGRKLFDARAGLRDVERALGALSDEQRATVVLVLVEGCSYREAAELLGVSEGTIASRLARAKPVLERLLLDAPEEVSDADYR
ncbi:MAG: RNA polymerase sigma factor [Rhodothalassiaceae bacterium]